MENAVVETTACEIKKSFVGLPDNNVKNYTVKYSHIPVKIQEKRKGFISEALDNLFIVL